MERSFNRISKTLKMPEESRERVRAQLASYAANQEVIHMRKTNLKKFIPLTAAAIAILSLTLAAAVIAPQFRNDIIVNSVDDIPDPASTNAPSMVAITAPNGNPPSTLEEITESDRFKSDGWLSKETIHGANVLGYGTWDDVEILDNDAPVRSRRVSRTDGAVKVEYTAENPIDLVETLTGRVSFDLSWMDGHYDYVPDANFSYVMTDPEGNYAGEVFHALYAKRDKSGYIRVELDYTAEKDPLSPSYIVDGSYETAYYYTTPEGYEFLIQLHKGHVWVKCSTNYTGVGLYGAHLTRDEVEDILDNLSLSIQ